MELSKYLTGLQHIGIPTEQINETIAFYEKLGFRVIHKTINEASHSAVAFLGMNGLIIETWEETDTCKRTGAIGHIALDVTDIEKIFSILKHMGYSPSDEEIRFLPFWEKGVRFFTIEGPNKEQIEFCQKL